MRKNSKFTPTELTSGKGFDFEDLVGAWLTTYMLSTSQIIPNEPTLIKAIHFQTGNNGWIFDDILVELSDGKKSFKLALSVKSNKQFTSQKAPDDLVEDMWKQFSNENTPFNSKCDYLGIVTAPLSGAAKTSLNSLLTKSRYLPEGDLQKQIDKAKLAKNVCLLHKSFNCPSTLMDVANKLNLNTDKVLKRFKAYQCDFYDQASSSEAQAINNIKNILVDPSASNATEVFEKICSLVKRFRVNGGVITPQIAASYIARDTQLKIAPEFTSDLEKLKAYSISSMSRVESSIGNQVSLLRTEEMLKINNSISSSNVSVVLGDSGSGKSALVKRFALSHENTVWFESSLFEYNSLHTAENGAFQLDNPWVELAAEITSKYQILVIDAVDQLWKPKYFSTLAEFLEPILSGNTSSLKIIITCQSFHWQRVQRELLKIGNVIATANPVSLSDISKADITILKSQFPQFAKLLVTESVSKFLLRPKILDLFSKLLPLSLAKSHHWRSEVELINWYWESEISSSTNGAMKESFLIKLSKLQADNLANATQVTMFEVSELSVLEELERSQICYRKKGKIYLAHDIYSDWFKQRTLVDELASSPSFLESCIKNPQWHRAISLFGSELVQNEHETSTWKDIITSALASKNFLLVDLLLEAIIHSSNSYELLLRHWEMLTTNRAVLLDRFFKRFLYVATEANKQTMGLAKQFNVSELDASLLNRIPVWLMWPGVLMLIIKKQDQLIELSPKNTVDICKLWITNTQKDYPYRKEVSEVVMKIGWRALQSNQHYRRHNEWIGHDPSNTSFFYEAVLSCATENKLEVIKFAYCASGIEEPTAELPPDPAPKPITDPLVLERLEELSTPYDFWHNEAEELPLIEDGSPHKRDGSFQELVLETSSFINLILMASKDAANIILANCIRSPGAKYRDSSFDIDKGYGLTGKSLTLFPPFYTKTPFLQLLIISPEQGKRVILRLTEIATTEWFYEESKRRENDKQNMFDEGYPLSVNLSINGIAKEYYGERRWMHACRNTTIVPQLLTCALMSLEKWLSDKLDNGEDIYQELEVLLTKSNSLAIVGVCIQLAKKESSLFKGVLLELLMCPWIFVYDLHHTISDERHQMIGHGMRETEHQFKEAQKWHLREYRKTQLDTIIFRKIITDKEFENRVKTKLIPAMQNWLNKTTKDDEHYVFILRLMHQFELKNWTIFENENGNIQFEFHAPKELLELQRKDETYFEAKQLILHLPHKCLAILNSNEQLDETEFQTIFDKLANIESDTFEKEDDYLFLVRSVCAVAAIVILKKEQLPTLYKEHGETCKSVLLHFPSNPPRQKLQIAESNFEIEWDRFCARALPKLLTKNNNDKQVRTAITHICLGSHYEALGVLISRCFQLREQLQEEFYRLLNLVNFWSTLRHRIRIATNDNTWGKEPLTTEQLDARAVLLANKFIDKKLPTKLPEWSNLQSIYIQYRNGKTNTREFPQVYRKVDCHVVMYGYAWLPPLNEATSVKEKNDWYKTYCQLSLVLWERLICELDESGEVNGTPYKIDSWIIEKIANTLLHCSKNEARKLWEPVLSLGAAAEYWLSDLMQKFFDQLLKKNVNQELFMSIWRDMLSFAKHSEAWSSQGSNWHKRHKVWEAIFGLESFTAGLIWKQDNSDLIRSMRDEFSYYAENQLASYQVDHFAHFLNTTSGKVLSLDGVSWIYQHMSKHKSSCLELRVQDSINDLITSILDTYNFDQLPDNIKKSILGLLKILADKQSTKAMALYKLVQI